MRESCHNIKHDGSCHDNYWQWEHNLFISMEISCNENLWQCKASAFRCLRHDFAIIQEKIQLDCMLFDVNIKWCTKTNGTWAGTWYTSSMLRSIAYESFLNRNKWGFFLSQKRYDNETSAFLIWHPVPCCRVTSLMCQSQFSFRPFVIIHGVLHGSAILVLHMVCQYYRIRILRVSYGFVSFHSG